MTRFSPDIRQLASRGLAILLPAGLLFAVWTVAAAPIINMNQDYQTQRTWLERRIAWERADIAAGPALKKQLIDLQAQKAQSIGALNDTSEDLANATLQNNIQDIVGDLGGQIVSVQLLKPIDQQIYQVVQIQVSMLIPANVLAELLKKLESHVPYMFVSAAAIQAPNDMLGPDSATTQLSLTCTVMSYWRPPASP